MQKIRTCLWFNGNAPEAMAFYQSVFPGPAGKLTYFTTDTDHGEKGKVLTAEWEMAGVEFMAINGDIDFPFSEAVSLSVDCADQAEVDRLWAALLADGGTESVCGWLKDRFGMSWQVVPRRLPELLADPDQAKAGRVLQAMMQMVKIDVAQLEAAAAAG
ncbi:VOC family protein [Phenylobacterium immobile]|uniref:VOC family protein n=1 Tax=Phenylobacterium immobile TaxID=21 RepID=UPI000AC5D867|nr:VOC family protein [Phenylobacterium immobile]